MALVRQVIPEAVVRTTVMIGHPGEGEAEFSELLGYVKEYGFDHLGCFVYQAEAGTRSARLAAPDLKRARERRREIMAAQGRISQARLKRLVGREQAVLVLGPHPESDLLGLGRLASQAPEVDGEVIITAGSATPGTIARCRITRSHTHDLEGELV
jgi:ribosomal protein S12 methylthiotransferase